MNFDVRMTAFLCHRKFLICDTGTAVWSSLDSMISPTLSLFTSFPNIYNRFNNSLAFIERPLWIFRLFLNFLLCLLCITNSVVSTLFYVNVFYVFLLTLIYNSLFYCLAHNFHGYNNLKKFLFRHFLRRYIHRNE